MNVSDLITEIRMHVHDTNAGEISATNALIMVQSAARDARSNGWLIHTEDDESITCAANDWSYDVPMDFAYVQGLLIEEISNGSSIYVTGIPRSHWDIRLNGGQAVFEFNTLQYVEAGKKIKVIGQKRPTIYANVNEEIDPGMESFLRERVLFFAFRYTGAGISELAKWRQGMANVSWQISEAFLKRHPQEFRVWPSALLVPGRA